jgi:hypothetical protein
VPPKPDTSTDEPSKTVNAFDIGYLVVPKEVKDFEVWPENWATWSLYREIGNQWRRAGMDGAAYAFDYNVLFHRMDRMRLSDKDYEQTFSLIKDMERAALDQMLSNSDDDT